SIGWRVGGFVRENGLLLMLLVLIVAFNAANSRFLTLANFTTLLEQNAPLLIVAVGMTFAIISNNIDLSPGSLIALSGVVVGLVFTATGSIVLGIIAGFATAIVAELFNGFLVARAGINPLIVTLAAWIWARGLAISFTDANSIVIRDPFVSFMNTRFGPISPPLVLIVLAYLLGWFLLNRTKLGRYTYAIGGDEAATRQAGVDTAKYKLLMFSMMGFFVAVAMLIALSRLGAAAPDAAYGLELDAIVAVIIGGNPFQGGEGSLRKTLVGALFIAVLNNGLSNLGMLDAYFYVYKGLAIVAALLFEVVSRRLLTRDDTALTAVIVPEAAREI
ncbi:MAG: ABC transporter permease, partial [Burkholderiales bacterium]|nr:ABC transporter permease [Anaerolineae bacterium]